MKYLQWERDRPMQHRRYRAQEREKKYRQIVTQVYEPSRDSAFTADPMVQSTRKYASPIDRAQPETRQNDRMSYNEKVVTISSRSNWRTSSWWDNNNRWQWRTII